MHNQKAVLNCCSAEVVSFMLGIMIQIILVLGIASAALSLHILQNTLPIGNSEDLSGSKLVAPNQVSNEFESLSICLRLNFQLYGGPRSSYSSRAMTIEADQRKALFELAIKFPGSWNQFGYPTTHDSFK